MKNYAQYKKDKKWSVAKEKVVTSVAVSEVKDDKGVVVRQAQDEVSHEEIKLRQKRYNSETGKAADDYVLTVSEARCDEEVTKLDNEIAELTAKKDGWTALKADIKAL